MAKRKTKTKTTKKTKLKRPSLKLSNQQKLILGSLLLILGILLFIAFLSYFFTGQADQSILGEFSSRQAKAENWMSKVGA